MFCDGVNRGAKHKQKEQVLRMERRNMPGKFSLEKLKSLAGPVNDWNYRVEESYGIGT